MSESGNPVRWANPQGDALAVSVNLSGNNTVVTPSSGNGIGLQYICLSADGGNGGSVVATVKFGTGGSAKYIVNLLPGAIWARNIGARMRWLAGAADAPLIVSLNAAETVHVSIEYEET